MPVGRYCLGPLAAGLLAVGLQGCDGSTGLTPPPDRGDDFNGRQDACPPLKKHPDGGAPDRIPPNDSHDKNASGHSNGAKDYFEGSWKFKRGDKDLIVTRWCIQQPREAGT